LTRIILIFTILSLFANTYANEKISYFTTSDSIEIGFIQYGNEKSPNLVFIHGGPGDNSSSFRGMAKQLSLDFRVTLFDSRGCGLSTLNLTTEELTISNYLNDLKELLEHLEIDRTTILGHSFGGAVAVEFASTYPTKIKQLVLSNPLISGLKAQQNRFEESYKFAKKENDTIKINTYKQWLSGDSITIWDEAKMLDVRHMWYNPDIIDSVFSYDYKSLGYSQEEFESGFEIILGYYESGFLPNYSVFDKLEHLKVKTIIIGASHDLIISSSDLRDASKSIPNCELYIIDKSGHFPFLEKPLEFKKLIKKLCVKG
jgi:proline iminopeptidase